MKARRRLPNRRSHEVIEFEHSGMRCRVGVGRFDTGEVAELFVNVAKDGSAVDVSARDAAIVASIALQYGAPADVIRRALCRDGSGLASGVLGAVLDIVAGDGSAP